MADDTATKFCSNCKRDIASINFMMHEVHCRRNIVLCPHCKEPVPKAELDAHFEENHAKVPCKMCKSEIEKSVLEDHELTSCPRRPQKCEYCELEVAAVAMDEHTNYCGTRTEYCPLCQKYIMHKDIKLHEDSGCTYPPQNSANGGSNNGNETACQRHLSDLPRDYYNSFAIGELNRVSGVPPPRNSVGNSGGVQNNLATSSKPGAPKPKVTNTVNASKNKSLSKGKYNADMGVYGQKKRSNVQMKKTNEERSQSNLDLDALLAAQLAGESDNNNGTGYTQGICTDSSADVDLKLPCEICGKRLPYHLLIDHQASCTFFNTYSSDEEDLLNPAAAVSVLPNNLSYLGPSSSHHPAGGQPHILNNLSTSAMNDWSLKSGSHPEESFDEIMLPCEFCASLFPEDHLIQHQAICDANVTQTPHVRSPLVQKPKSTVTIPRPSRLQRSVPNPATLGAPSTTYQRHQSRVLGNFGLDGTDYSGASRQQQTTSLHKAVVKGDKRNLTKLSSMATGQRRSISDSSVVASKSPNKPGQVKTNNSSGTANENVVTNSFQHRITRGENSTRRFDDLLSDATFTTESPHKKKEDKEKQNVDARTVPGDQANAGTINSDTGPATSSHPASLASGSSNNAMPRREKPRMVAPKNLSADLDNARSLRVGASTRSTPAADAKPKKPSRSRKYPQGDV